MTSPAVSHHLRLLKGSGLIVSRREGKEMYYRTADTELAQVLHHNDRKARTDHLPRAAQLTAYIPIYFNETEVFIMEKDPDCQIREHLRDVPPGKFLMIRHSLYGETAAEPLRILFSRTAHASKQKHICSIPGLSCLIIISWAAGSVSTIVTKTVSSLSTTAAMEGSAGR